MIMSNQKRSSQFNWIGKSSESMGSSGVDKMEGDGEFDNKQKFCFKDTKEAVFIIVVIRSVMLYGAETWALTGKFDDKLISCDRRKLRYMAIVR